jgi:hypothetical protein
LLLQLVQFPLNAIALLLKLLDPLSPSRIGTAGLPIPSPNTACGDPPGREKPRTNKNQETYRSQTCA